MSLSISSGAGLFCPVTVFVHVTIMTCVLLLGLAFFPWNRGLWRRTWSMTMYWGISSRALFLGEGRNRGDILIVRRIQKPFSIHHLHTEHPWVLVAPFIAPSPLRANRPWESPAKTNKYNKNATEALCWAPFCQVVSVLIALWVSVFAPFLYPCLRTLYYVYWPFTIPSHTGGSNIFKNSLRCNKAKSPHQTLVILFMKHSSHSSWCLFDVR